MSYQSEYSADHPDRATIDSIEAPLVVEFGTNWCGHCRAAQPLIEEAFQDYPHLRHIKAEDDKGRRLGRSFKVKLWPTLIFLRNGKEVARLVRPRDSDEIRRALAAISEH